MLIETYLLEQFEAVARCGTLLKASEELHISQPSLSRSMKKLEDVLGAAGGAVRIPDSDDRPDQ